MKERKTMKKRSLALLLTLVLGMSAILPLPSMAAGKDPLVMQTKEDEFGKYQYYYDAQGRCVFRKAEDGDYARFTYGRNGKLIQEEFCSDGKIGWVHKYTYWPNGNLETHATYREGTLQEKTVCDEFGTVVETWYYQRNQKNPDVQKHFPEYDEYGRLICRESTWLMDRKGNRTGEKILESTSYTYGDGPVTLSFGTWEQDGNPDNGPEPIEWEVLDAGEGQMLLVSRYGLECRPYHSKNIETTWENSALREWLNGSFLDQAFSDGEQYQIGRTLTEQCVIDKVFVLSLDEAEYYFSGDQHRICTAAKSAVKKGAYVNRSNGGSWWYLRTAGSDSSKIMSVNSDGTIDYDGGSLTSQKGVVRPALWVSVTAMQGHPNLLDQSYLETYYLEDGTEDTGEICGTEWEQRTYNDEGVLIYYSKGYEDDRFKHLKWDDCYYEKSETYYYDDYGNVTKSKVVLSEDEEPYVGNFTYENRYNKAGQLLKSICRKDGELRSETDYRYDRHGRKISEVTVPAEASWELPSNKKWSYDSKGNLLTMTDNGDEWDVYTYDRYGNVLTHSVLGDVKETYTYVPLSQALWDEEL